MGNRRSLIVALCVLLALGAAVGVLWLRSDPSDRAAIQGDETARAPTQAESAPSADAEPETASSHAESAEQARPAAPEATRVAVGQSSAQTTVSSVVVSVRDTKGGPIEGAHVSLTPLDAEALGFFYGAEASDKLWLWRERSDRIAANTSTERTDADGLASLPRSAATDGLAPGAWALWASHTNHVAAVEIRGDAGTEGEHPALDGRIEFVLEPALAASLRVLDPHGAPVEGARVEQWALFPLGLHPADAPLDVRARRVLLRGGNTDAAGKHALQAYASRQMVHVDATFGGAVCRAVALLEEPSGTVDVQLEATFELVGRVRWDGPTGPGPYGLVTVDALPEVGRRTIQGVAHVAPDGSFGPVLVPFPADVPELRVRLEHSGLVPCSTTIPRPAPNERVYVEFETKSGFDVWVQAVDANTEEPLPDTRITLVWSEPAGRAQGWTSAIGWTYFEALPEGEITMIADKVGYARERVGPMLVSAERWAGQSKQIDLFPAGRLQGTVTDGSKPATAFEVVVVRDGYFAPVEGWHFSGRADGSFEIHELAPGKYNVRALLPGARVTQPELVGVRLEDTAVVDLEASGGAQVVGRVLSAVELSPLAGVDVQLQLADGGITGLLALGAGARTGADGRFELPYAPSGQSLIVLTGPSGEARAVTLPAESVARIDVGDVLLAQKPRVEVHMVGDPGQPMDTFFVRSREARTWIPVPPEGVISLETVDVGARIVLRHTDGMEDVLAIASPSDRREPVRLFVRPGEVRVRLEGGGAAVDAATFEHHTHYLDPEGQSVFRSGENTGREWVMAGLATTRAHMFVRAKEGDLSGVAMFDIDAEGNGEAVVDMGPAAWVRLVDAAAVPLQGAFVEVSIGEAQIPPMLPRETTVFYSRSDGDGRIHVPNRAPARGGVWLVSGVSDLGVRFGEWELPKVEPGAEPVDLTIRTDLQLAVRVQEMGQPIRHANLRMFGAQSGIPYFQGNTDTAGQASFGPMGVAAVWVELADARYFALPRTAIPAASAASVEIEAYSRADLELRVLTSSGQPVPGASATLVHQELGTDVSVWIQAGRVQGVLTTGADGELQLSGLPRGRYRVAVESSLGSASGELEVQASKKNTLTLVVP
ncbi:MAG: hypothetical protein GC161_16535 [Planctomycetaceae bacterium]|nr:hypothetical protein [Planctomycetaceae bacterium]